ncbi:MAG: copper chaperone PCu(A)C [Calditrichaeota bacterium]|nr:MAG: copper chaperone PCu(A)C [Calditrichota bacterium]
MGGLKLHFLLFFLFMVLILGCRKSSPDEKVMIKEVWSRPVGMAAMSGEADSSHAHHMNMKHGEQYTGVVYMTIQNPASTPDTLISAESDICERIELHQSIMKGDQMFMQRVEGGLEIPPQKSVALKPGSYHLMMLGVRKSLKEGDTFPVTLHFQKSGSMIVESKVRY